jgi:hypothetical protein
MRAETEDCSTLWWREQTAAFTDSWCVLEKSQASTRGSVERAQPNRARAPLPAPL